LRDQHLQTVPGIERMARARVPQNVQNCHCRRDPLPLELLRGILRDRSQTKVRRNAVNNYFHLPQEKDDPGSNPTKDTKGLGKHSRAVVYKLA
jgi:hypothetical protein